MGGGVRPVHGVVEGGRGEERLNFGFWRLQKLFFI